MIATVVLGLGASACASGEPGGGDVDARKQEVDAAPNDGSLPIDAPLAIDAPSTTDAPTSGTPDTCGNAMDITTAAMMAGGTTVTGDTTGYADDVNPDTSCTGYGPDGPDAIYFVNVAAGKTITATATPGGTWDISLEIVTPCATTPTCLAGADVGFGGDPETITYTTTAAGIVYIVVDSYDTADYGPYSMNVRVQ